MGILLRGCNSKIILGKPDDLAHAKEMLRMMCEEPMFVVTACNLAKYQFHSGDWVLAEANKFVVSALVEFHVDAESVDLYFARVPGALSCCGGASIEEFGSNFLKRIDGSYAAVQGLPIYELRQALKHMGFFS